MLDATDLARTLAVPCPLTACAAFLGEDCVSFVTGRALDVPHRHRLVAAGVMAQPPAPIPARDGGADD